MPGGQLAQQLHGPALAAQLVLVGLLGQGPQQPLGQLVGRLDGHRDPPLELEVAQLGHVALHGPDRRRGRAWPPGPGSRGWRRPGPGSRAQPPWPRRPPAPTAPCGWRTPARRRPARPPAAGSAWPSAPRPAARAAAQVVAGSATTPAPPAIRARGARRGGLLEPRRAVVGRSVPGAGGCQPGPPGVGGVTTPVHRRGTRRPPGSGGGTSAGGGRVSSTATSRRELPVSPAGAAWRRTRMASCRAASSSMSSS